VARTAIPTPPKGYKLAWKDDRLNPQRAQGTAQGQAAQDQVWTRTTPSDLVVVAAPASPALNTSVSTMSAPQTRVTAATLGAAYVQVGTFGQPANATGAAARLAALGLPVATSRITRSGKALQIVLAGPFDSTAAAQSALVILRGAGFGDAILK
jgi:cell division protein FtsN